ncbi:MAG TPA: hypothetical protein DIT76_06410 [Spartobacteria bacterium]|jgi:hypothetical protein|nr:hypothetical protein [Spartobacteria bacterium]HCP91659.1 hypothetical protein [Spartobacteria bacterium]
MLWLKEEFLRIDRSTKALRRFGFTLGGLSILLGLWLMLQHRPATWPFILVGTLMICAGFFALGGLKYLHAGWTIFSLVLGWVMTRVILTVVFFLVVTPVGLLQRLFRHSPLELGFRIEAGSYWLTRRKLFDPADYRNQF